MEAMTIALYVVGILLFLVGLAGLALPFIPGSPVMFLGVVAIAWADDFERIGIPGLIVIGLLAAVVFLTDWLAEAVGARRLGASWWGMAGAVLGLLVGLPFGLLGVVVGPIIGAVALELTQDRDLRRASKVGVGTVIGFLVGTAVKYSLALVMTGLVLLFYLY